MINFLLNIREYIIFFRKICCIIIVVYFEFDTMSKSLMLIIIFVLLLSINFKLDPYLSKNLNLLSANENLTILFTIILSTLSSITTNQIARVFLDVMTSILNFQFIILTLKMILLYKLFSLKGFANARISRIVNFLQKFLSKTL